MLGDGEHGGRFCGWRVTQELGSQSLLHTHLCSWPLPHGFLLRVGVWWGSRWVGACSQGLGDKSQIKGCNFSRAPSLTWAPDEQGPGVWLCKKENNALRPDTGPHWWRTQPCLRHPGMCEALRGCFAPSGILTAAWRGRHCPCAHFPDGETEACPRSPVYKRQSHGRGLVCLKTLSSPAGYKSRREVTQTKLLLG